MSEVKKLNGIKAVIISAEIKSGTGATGPYEFGSVTIRSPSGETKVCSSGVETAKTLATMIDKEVELQLSDRKPDKFGTRQFRIEGIGTEAEVSAKLAEAAANKKPFTPYKKGGSGFQKKTPEEERRIILQNSTGHMVQLAMHNSKGEPVTLEQIMEMASKYTDMLLENAKSKAPSAVSGSTSASPQTTEKEPVDVSNLLF